jgi:hypothetical protein
MHPPLLARKQVRVRAFQCNIYPKCEKVMRQPQLHMCMRVLLRLVLRHEIPQPEQHCSVVGNEIEDV